jgi:hypothetical protein
MIKTIFLKTAFLATVFELPDGEYKLFHSSRIYPILKKGGKQ